MDVSIVIVNWNSKHLLLQCLTSIQQFGGNEVLEVIVIDNNSTDGSLQKADLFPKVNIVRSEKNLGFAKACNIGFKLSKGTYCLLLNPDTRIFAGTIQRSIEFLQENKSIDILGCRHVGDKGETQVSCARFPRFSTFLNDITGLSKLFPRSFHSATLMTDWDHNSSREVDQVMGAFMFMRREIFTKHGFFDERFFVYFEELDFCLRVKQAGGTIFYNADFSIYHKANGTTAQVRSYSLFLSLHSRLKYIRKHFPLYQFIILAIGTITFEFVVRSVFSIRLGWNGFKNNFQGYKMLILNLAKTHNVQEDKSVNFLS